MATNTYVAIDKVTANGSVNTLTIASIPTTYTDLIIIESGNLSGSANRASLAMRVGNGSPDSGTNYSNTQLSGNAVSAYSNRGTNETYCFTGVISEKVGNVIISIMNYSNTTTYKTILSRGNSLGQTATQDVGGFINLWRSTAAINTIQFYTGDGTNFSANTTFSLYGVKAEGISPAPKATGGAIYDDETYYYHVFGATGTFTPLASLSADVLVVAGGGGSSGGGGEPSGGGGAGGLLAWSAQSLTATGYTVTVGGGGARNSGTAVASNGSNSQFGALTAVVGGGRGGTYNGATGIGASGGSGGGGSGWGDPSARSGGAGTSGQGNAGGTGRAASTAPYSSGGGGGAGAAGYNGDSPTSGGGDGGVGVSTYSSWGIATGVGQNVGGTYYLAGGGGGGSFGVGTRAGLGGYGGGGNGVNVIPANGTNGLASSGGGGGAASGGGTGGSGGSGVVIVRYAKV